MMTALIILAGAALIFLIAFDVFSVLIKFFRERSKRHIETPPHTIPREISGLSKTR